MSDSSTNGSSIDAPVIPAQPLTFGERVTIYERSFIHPENLIGLALGAGIGQWRDTPTEWGQGADAYGIRLASGFGRSVISRTIAFGVAAVDREDPRFVPSNESGIWRRTRHAIVGTFVSRTPSGGSMPAFSRFAGVYSAGFIANAWEPRSQNDASHALERGSTALLSSVRLTHLRGILAEYSRRISPSLRNYVRRALISQVGRLQASMRTYLATSDDHAQES